MKRLAVLSTLLMGVFLGVSPAADNNAPPPGGQKPEVTSPLVGVKERSVLDHLHLKLITKIKISHQAKGEFATSADKFIEVTDTAAIARMAKVLGEIPATGTVHKDFPPGAERWRITLLDASGKLSNLYFVTNRLRAPITTNGEFYAGDVVKHERELLKQVRDLMKQAK